MGDISSGGGAVVFSPNFNVFANFLPVAVAGSLVGSHAPCPASPDHCAAITTPSQFRIFANFLPVNKQFDYDTCGHIRIMASFDVFVGF